MQETADAAAAQRVVRFGRGSASPFDRAHGVVADAIHGKEDDIGALHQRRQEPAPFFDAAIVVHKASPAGLYQSPHAVDA